MTELNLSQSNPPAGATTTKEDGLASDHDA
jgi:hypothetical protein